MRNNPAISVVMSVYNAEVFLSKSIDSILTQTFKDFEFILIDDGSKDDSYQLMQKYENDDSRIICFKNEQNLGLPASLNIGIANAKGRYIARQDADDYSFPERLQKQFDFMEQNSSIHLCGTNCRRVDIEGNVIYEKTIYAKIKDFKSFLFERKSIFPHGSAFMRSETLKQIGGYNENFYYSQDGELWLRFLKQGYGIKVLPDILYDFTWGPRKNDKKIYGQKTYNNIKKKMYEEDTISIKEQNNLEEESKKIKDYLMHSNDFKNHKYFMSAYWFLLARVSMREGKNIRQIWRYLFKSLQTKDSIKKQTIKLVWFILPIIPVKTLLSLKKKFLYSK